MTLLGEDIWTQKRQPRKIKISIELTNQKIWNSNKGEYKVLHVKILCVFICEDFLVTEAGDKTGLTEKPSSATEYVTVIH